jgi:purine-binding chemotaxis protein CheW
MNKLSPFVIFCLDNQKYALPLPDVKRVVRALEIKPLPKAPEIVLGVIRIEGQIIPVINIRKRFRLPEREIDPKDRFIIADTSKNLVALVVDDVRGVKKSKREEKVKAEKILPGIKYIEGVVKLDDDMAFIHDLGKFLSLEEEKKLDDAIEKAGKR